MDAASRFFGGAVVCVMVTSWGCSRTPNTDAADRSDTTRSDSIATPKPSDSSAASTSLRGTYWTLVSVGDKTVPPPADTQRVAHIVLQTDSKTVAGATGCNRLFGVFELNGEALRFSGVGSTKMACKNGMDTEAAFLPVLLRVRRWKVTGQQLELSDSAGVLLARLEAKAK